MLKHFLQACTKPHPPLHPSPALFHAKQIFRPSGVSVLPFPLPFFASLLAFFVSFLTLNAAAAALALALAALPLP